MARAWRVKFRDGGGVVHTSYIHDDGRWEQAATLPLIGYVELAELISRINLAAAQFTRLGWLAGEIEKEV